MRAAVLVAVLAALVASAATAAGVLVVERSRSVGGDGAPAAEAGMPDIRALLDRTQPSVVAIRTDEATTAGVHGGAGSGVIISEDGLVLTNAHVVDRAGSITVTLDDGSIRHGALVGSYPDADVALLRIDGAAGLVPAPLGSSADVRVGDRVVAIGNALNLGGSPSVTEGIISAKDRTIDARNLTLRNLLQTDAAINEGNSGGPLLNASGQVIGINTAIISDAQNIGFAIAVDEIKPLIEDLQAGKGTITPETAFLGVATIAVEDVNASTRREYLVTAGKGAFVSELVKDSPAARSGLAEGDVIVEIDGVAVAAPADVGRAVRAHRAGDTVPIVVERRGERVTVQAVLETRGG